MEEVFEQDGRPVGDRFIYECFLRMLPWLNVSHELGVFSVILLELWADLRIFAVIFGLVILGFSMAMGGLMPTLGSGTAAPDGPFFLPFWAM